ncbi:hypothetical protein Hamer_G019211 [Homarus americanus]|uniref:Uncharacterized protein n=1 Tax=Homarus americanus TaxID=6706 RepID=A0A8J5JH37_HOMAM|nr:hypothetical protein Hamer_G019211 [Homarus americanus]
MGTVLLTARCEATWVRVASLTSLQGSAPRSEPPPGVTRGPVMPPDLLPWGTHEREKVICARVGASARHITASMTCHPTITAQETSKWGKRQERVSLAAGGGGEDEVAAADGGEKSQPDSLPSFPESGDNFRKQRMKEETRPDGMNAILHSSAPLPHPHGTNSHLKQKNDG